MLADQFMGSESVIQDLEPALREALTVGRHIEARARPQDARGERRTGA
ncbi:hypothetical protein R6V09_44375 [Streptomyces sp. W16]|nr:hypothetical protein [Streptomyces sp. W16]MDV9177154.1 hypothetical protein [Streptomyces sp. W16]